MDIPEDLGQRIVEATRLAVMLHIQHSLQLESFPGGTGRATGGAVNNRARAGGGASETVGGASETVGGASATRGGVSVAESEAA